MKESSCRETENDNERYNIELSLVWYKTPLWWSLLVISEGDKKKRRITIKALFKFNSISI